MTHVKNIAAKPWLWPILSSIALFVIIYAYSPNRGIGIFTANLAAASYLALVGIGQMFPVASGEGGVDLSVPFVMNFCAFLSVKIVGADPSSVYFALAAGVAFGMTVGAINGIVVVRFRIPAIIGTLAVGYIVLTLVQLISSQGATRFSARYFTELIRSNLFGIPTPFFAVVVVGGLAALLIARTSYGQSLLAVGQSRQASHLSGIKVDRTVVLAYVICGGFAGLSGVLLCATVGSADLELGNPFLLASVGAVVLGGNRIAGGMATVVGTIAGALVLTLLVAAVTMAGLPLEFQNVARGVVITLVLVLANPPDNRRGGTRSPFRRAQPAPTNRGSTDV